MSELELKFRLDDDAAARWQARLRAAGGQVRRLRARYFDTPDGRLAQARIALRLREEDGRWLQTLKAPGASPVERYEDEVAVAAAGRRPPELDIGRHGGDGARLLERALGDADRASLTARHATEVQRLVATLDHGDGETEAALDHGTVRAGKRQAPIAELELEHRSGAVGGLFALAVEAVGHGGLWLSTVSKAERGERLARDGSAAPAKAEPLDHLPAHADGAALLRAVLRNTLAQVLANASEVAEGADGAEAIHQLRVGVRRLRTALRELRGLSAAIDVQWDAELRETFARLGERRDHDAVADAVRPLLEAAGAPKTSWSPPAFPDTKAAVRAPAFQRTLLGIMALAHAPDAAFLAQPHGALKAMLARRLDRLDRAVRRDGRRFDRLPAERQHRVRKRLKRLRYLAEFAAPLWSDKTVSRYVERLKPAQDALGAHQDGLVAASRFRDDAQTDPRSWFAAGWLEARGATTARDARRALRKIGKGDRFWR